MNQSSDGWYSGDGAASRVERPSLWRTVWKGPDAPRPSWQLWLAIGLIVAVPAVSTIPWSWAVAAFGPAIGFARPFPWSVALLIISQSPIFVGITMNSVRPKTMREITLACLVATGSAVMSQFGIVAAFCLAVTFADTYAGIVSIVIPATVLCLVPAVSLMSLAPWLLDRRGTGRPAA